MTVSTISPTSSHFTSQQLAVSALPLTPSHPCAGGPPGSQTRRGVWCLAETTDSGLLLLCPSSSPHSSLIA